MKLLSQSAWVRDSPSGSHRMGNRRAGVEEDKTQLVLLVVRW